VECLFTACTKECRDGENEKDKQFKANFDTIRGQICNSSNKESSVLSIISLINLHKINKNSNESIIFESFSLAINDLN
jgi:hypothetical protein